MTPETPPAALPEDPGAKDPGEDTPFWGFRDLALFLGIAFPSLLVSALAVKAVAFVLHISIRQRALEMVPAQFLGYGLLFLGLAMLFRMQYARPFWRSLGWRPSPLAPALAILCGVLLAIAVELIALLLKTPDTSNPMRELLSDPASLALIAIFGTTLGPLCEELIFRGFMQPLFVRSLGVLPGILLAAVPFGLLHLEQYGNSWRHGLLITLAGAAFGWMRHATRSTQSSTWMHAAYNLVFFAGLIAQDRAGNGV